MRYVEPTSPVSSFLSSTRLDQFLNRKSYIFCNLPQENRRNVSSFMKGDRCPSSVRVAILHVRASLADFPKPQRSKETSDFPGSEHRYVRHYGMSIC